MSFSIFKDHGILGINARNLQYIRPFNRRKAVKMADSKLKTKQFLSTRGTPVPKLIGTIRSREELEKYDFSQLPDSFVLKPDAGFGGEGIFVIAGRIDATTWETIGGRRVTAEDLREHASDILDGSFSIGSLPDTAFFETRLASYEFIPGLAVAGLPDIRVIVHNLVPAMAMLRIPTPESEGKANVHLGGIGVGIDLATGKTTHAVQKNNHLDEFPGGIAVAGHEIPDWDEILKIAAAAQLHTNLGYLAADIVVDERDGPVLIEVNARAGLMVQIANLAPLKTRLERIRGLDVKTPEEGVKLGKQLFGSAVKKKKGPKKKVVSVFEPAEILVGEEVHRVTAECDPTHKTTAIDRELAQKIGLEKVGESEDVHLKIILGEQRITTVAELEDLSGADFKIILGRRDLADFLIDPTLQKSPTLPKVEEAAAAEEEKFDFVAADRVIVEVDKKIKLLAHLKPTNLASERKKFFADKKYEPHFHYPKIKFDPADLREKLQKISPPDNPLGRIFVDKIDEIDRKISLLEKVGTPEFSAASEKLYGFPTEEEIEIAEKFLAERPKKFARETATLDAETAAAEFAAAFEKYDLTDWKVKIKDEMAADALAGKGGTLFVRRGSLWSPERLRATIAHEVGTHILRGENGKNQPYEIFSRGLADYLGDEEGLAIFNQNFLLAENAEKRWWPAVNLLAVAKSAELGFRGVFDFVRAAGFDDERAWRTTLKVKRGLADTSAAGGFTKEAAYFSGWLRVKKFVEEGGEMKIFYGAKMKISDVDLVKKLPKFHVASRLPEFYKKN